VLIAFILMHALGITSNIMSLAASPLPSGDGRRRDRHDREMRISAWNERLGYARTRDPAQARDPKSDRLSSSVSSSSPSPSPRFTLAEGQEGRLFKPLVYTYTFRLAGAALLR